MADLELKRITTPGRDVVVYADNFGAVILAIELREGPNVVALLEQADVDQLAGALSNWLGVSPFSPRGHVYECDDPAGPCICPPPADRG